MLYAFELGHDAAEATKNISEYGLGQDAAETTKNIYYVNNEGTVDHSPIIKLFKKSLSGCLMIRQGQVGLKPWIPMLCYKPLRQIQLIVLWEYQVSSVSHSTLYFVIFTTSLKASRAAKLCLMLHKIFHNLLLIVYLQLAFLLVHSLLLYTEHN